MNGPKDQNTKYKYTKKKKKILTETEKRERGASGRGKRSDKVIKFAHAFVKSRFSAGFDIDMAKKGKRNRRTGAPNA